MRMAALAAVVIALLAAPAEGRFHYTHRFTATGHLVDHWTINGSDECEPSGTGTVTVEFRSARPSKAMPAIDPAHSGMDNTSPSWALLAPVDSFGHIGSAPPKRATGTVTLEDNTHLNDCGDSAPDKSGCGSHRLPADTKVAVAGYNRRFIYVDLLSDQFNSFGACNIGLVDLFSQPDWAVGGALDGVVAVRMPSPSRLRNQRVVKVSAHTHKRKTYLHRTSDVTRTVTVTFTRLH